MRPTKLNTFGNCNFVKSLSEGQHVINRKVYLTVKETSKNTRPQGGTKTYT